MSKRKYGASQRKKGENLLENAVVGNPTLLVSCVRGKERECAREVMDLIDQMYPAADNTADQSGNDVQASLEAELEALRRETETRFRLFYTRGTSLIAVQLDPEDTLKPSDVAVKVATFISESGRAHTRHTCRFFPMDVTCFSTMEDIEPCLTRFVPNRITEMQCQEKKFAIDIRTRSNKAVDRKQCIDLIASLVTTQDPAFSVDLTAPSLLIMANTSRRLTGFCIVRQEDYQRGGKLNVQAMHAKETE